jgi:hypothetical protein
MQFENKIAVVLRDDLAVWQRTNIRDRSLVVRRC